MAKVPIILRRAAQLRLIGLVPVLCAALACSAHSAGERQAGTGDIAFRLVWDGESDLDLFVEDPAGTCIFFGNRDSVSGGLLDVDCNAGSDRVCEHPVENVYWSTGTAPAGSYKYWIEAHSLIPAEGPLAFELQLLRGTGVVWRHAGSLQATEEIVGPFGIDIAAGKGLTPVAIGQPPPECPFRELGEPAPEGR
jgi:hypothetical protein